jgi:small subunit ribosomal protein S13
MARISGVDLPKNKKIEYALRYIYGIGLTKAKGIVAKAQLNPEIRVKDLSESEILTLRECINENLIEGDLRRRVHQDIKRLKDIGVYRGVRHRKNLPVRGQRTHTNARTKKGKAVAIAGKRKAPKK